MERKIIISKRFRNNSRKIYYYLLNNFPASTAYNFPLRLEKRIEKGIFGADMKVSLINDGPVTIVLDTEKIMKRKPDL